MLQSPKAKHGRIETRKIWTTTELNDYLDFPHVGKARLPKPASPPLRIVRFSGIALNFGVEHHMIEKVAVPIFSPSKTVADCFKYRNKIGLDVAIEALRDCLRQRKATRDALADAAKACRVSAVMRPYLEALS